MGGRGAAARRASATLALLLVVCASDAAPKLPFKVIVHSGVSGKSVTKELLKEVFLRRTLRWGDGTPIAPVDLLSSSAARSAFNREVLALSALDVQRYWVLQMSQGRVPPPAKKTEDEVIAFVASTPGAIGYVSDTTPTPETVRELQVH